MKLTIFVLGFFLGTLVYLFEKRLAKEDNRTFGAIRSPQWPKVREAYLKLNPFCATCGKKDDLNVHHMMPFHLNPSLELQISNLITLCEPCHLLIGHLGSFRSFNKDVKDDAEKLNLKIKQRP